MTILPQVFWKDEVFAKIDCMLWRGRDIEGASDLTLTEEQQLTAVLLKALIEDDETFFAHLLADYMLNPTEINKQTLLFTLAKNAHHYMDDMIDEAWEFCDLKNSFEKLLREYLRYGESNALINCLVTSTIHRFSDRVEQLLDEKLWRKSLC